MKGKYLVYVLKCSDNTLYCGTTNDLDKRLYAHNNLKSGAKYTRGRRPVTLVYSEQCDSYAQARKREGEIKSLSTNEKKRLALGV